MVKNKHLTDSEREKIEKYLCEDIPLKGITVHLGRSTSTVSREIRARAIKSDKYPRTAFTTGMWNVKTVKSTIFAVTSLTARNAAPHATFVTFCARIISKSSVISFATHLMSAALNHAKPSLWNIKFTALSVSGIHVLILTNRWNKYPLP